MIEGWQRTSVSKRTGMLLGRIAERLPLVLGIAAFSAIMLLALWAVDNFVNA